MRPTTSSPTSRVWGAAEGSQHLVGLDGRAVCQVEAYRAVTAHRGGADAGAHVDPGVTHPVGHVLRHELLVPPEHPRAAFHQRDLRAQTGVRLRELARHDATAQYGQTRRIHLDVVASRFVHGLASLRPGMFGTDGIVPVARTTACRASSTWSPTSTRRSPASRPLPRTTAIPMLSAHVI